MTRVLLLATRNPDKVREIREILSDINVHIRSLLDFPEILDIVEDAPTLEENALKKARSAFSHSGLPSLADDSGLEVPYLNNQPGVYSARYAGEKSTYDDNNRKLLSELRDARGEQRRAQFRCVIAFVGAGYERIAEGICPGRIAESPRGTEGFGYDPLFIPDGFEQTFAELPAEVKNRISHRSRALGSFIPFLQSYFI